MLSQWCHIERIQQTSAVFQGTTDWPLQLGFKQVLSSKRHRKETKVVHGVWHLEWCFAANFNQGCRSRCAPPKANSKFVLVPNDWSDRSFRIWTASKHLIQTRFIQMEEWAKRVIGTIEESFPDGTCFGTFRRSGGEWDSQWPMQRGARSSAISKSGWRSSHMQAASSTKWN